MNKFIFNLVILFLFFLQPTVAQGAACIFSGTEVKCFKSALNLFDTVKILTGTDDPTSVAQDAPRASLYLRTSTGAVYKKTDNGSSTNWTELASGSSFAGPGSATDNAITRFDGTGGSTVQDSGVIIDDSDNVTGIADLTISGTATIGSLGGVVKASSGALSASAIVNADIDAAAAINFSKMENLTADRALISDGSGDASVSAVTATELGVLGSGIDADEVAYSNSTSGLTATDAQAAIDEIDGNVDTNASDLSTHISDTTTHGTTGDILGTSDVQTVTNKNIDADNNTISNLEIGSEVSSSVTVPIIMTNQNGTVYREQSGNGTNAVTITAADSMDANYGLKLPPAQGLNREVWLNDGSGNLYWGNLSSGKNYLEGFFAGNNSIDVGTFDDTSAIVDGDGGSPSTVSAADETSDPLDGSTSINLVKSAADGQWEGWTLTSDAVELADLGDRINISFKWRTSANYAHGDVQLYACSIHDCANTLKSLQVTGANSPQMPVCTDKCTVTAPFFTTADTTQIKVILGIVTTNASAYTLTVDRVRGSPDSIVLAGNQSDWKPYSVSITATSSNPTKASVTDFDQGYYRRIADGYELMYTYTHSSSSGAANGSGTYLFSVPTDCTIDSTKVASNNSGIGGSAFVFGTATGTMMGSSRINVSNNAVVLTVGNASSADAGVTSSFGQIAQNDVTYSFNISVPCEGFSAGNLMSTSEAAFNTAYFEASKASDQNIASASPTKVTWSAGTDSAGAFDDSNDRYVIPSSSWYDIDACALFENISSEQVTIAIYIDGSLAKIAGGSTGSDTSHCVPLRSFLNQGQYVEVFVDSTADTSYDIDETANGYTSFSVAAKNRLNTVGINGVLENKSFTSSADTPTTDNVWNGMTGNCFTDLTPGRWKIWGTSEFNNGGVSPGYSQQITDWHAANGDDTATEPSELSTVATVISSNPDFMLYNFTGSATRLPAQSYIISTTSTITVCLNTRASMSTPSNARITVYGNAERLQ